MFQMYHKKLLRKFYVLFSILTKIHDYNTRNTKFLKYLYLVL